MKKIASLILLLLTGIAGFGQNSNFRAQGNYYSAKTNFEAKNYEEALSYVNKCKTALGGTNYQLQYLHILAAYKLYKYEEAAKELQTYFDIEEKKAKAVYFDKSVDELTSDETKALTMLIDPILESVEQLKNNPCEDCQGTGLAYKIYTCTDCNGAGHTKMDCARSKAGEYCNNGTAECACTSCNSKGAIPCIKGVHTHYGIIQIYANCRNCRGGYVTCDNCNGAGTLKKECVTCNSTGKLESSEKLTCNRCYGKGFKK